MVIFNKKSPKLREIDICRWKELVLREPLTNLSALLYSGI